MSARLAIGPANYAGQAYAWAEAVNTHTQATAEAFTVARLRGGGYHFRSHRVIPAPAYYLPLFRAARARGFLRKATHVLLDGFRPIFYDRSPEGFARQASAIAQTHTLGLFAHGSDVRDPDAHIARCPNSYFLEGDDDFRRRCSVVTSRNRALARELGVPLFVSTPDMLYDLPEATWVPVCLDLSVWRTDAPLLPAGRRPRVLFVPSQRTPPIKGTQYVDPVLRRLEAQGVIEYLAPTRVPHQHMVALVKSADIVVDQLLFGSYGVAAIEAMAAGRAVVGNLSTLTDRHLPQRPRVVTATPEDFEEVLRDALTRPEELRSDAAHNLAFVTHWHDGRESARRLADFLGVATTGSFDR